MSTKYAVKQIKKGEKARNSHCEKQDNGREKDGNVRISIVSDMTFDYLRCGHDVPRIDTFFIRRWTNGPCVWKVEPRLGDAGIL